MLTHGLAAVAIWRAVGRGGLYYDVGHVVGVTSALQGQLQEEAGGHCVSARVWVCVNVYVFVCVCGGMYVCVRVGVCVYVDMYV